MVFDAEDACAFARHFEGPGSTNLMVSEDVDGELVLNVSNYGWSIGQDDRFTLRIRIGNTSFRGPAIGYRSGISRGFVTRIDQQMLNLIGSENLIQFYRLDGDNVTFIDGLRLDGSGTAIALMRRCVPEVRTRVARERAERERLAQFPRDPFAAPSPPTATVPRNGPMTAEPVLRSRPDLPLTPPRRIYSAPAPEPRARPSTDFSNVTEAVNSLADDD